MGTDHCGVDLISADALRFGRLWLHNYSRQTVSRLLRHFHYDVVAAPDYRTASALLDKWQFDVLLSDIRLPDGDGCNLVTVAKSKQPLVAIALTGLGIGKDESVVFRAALITISLNR